MIEQAARIEAARQTLRSARCMWFFPFPYESAAMLRERGFGEADVIRWIKGREPAKAEDLADWCPEDVTEYWAIFNGPDAPQRKEPADLPEPAPQTSAQALASATAAPTVIIHNTFPAFPTTAPYRPPEPAPDPEPAREADASSAPYGYAKDGPAAQMLTESVESAQPTSARKRAEKRPPIDKTKTLITSLIPRINEDELKRGRVNKDSARDFERTLALFTELTGVEYVQDINQAALADFVDAHDDIPKNYRKSEAERTRSIWDIINEAEINAVETGLSAPTINKNLTNINKLLKKAEAWGCQTDGVVNTSLLRISEKGAKKDKKLAFTHEEIVKIFEHPHLSPDGNRDALFWITHCAAYTGARREEMAGLDAVDIEERKGVPVFLIRENAHRGLKNGQSERIIPLHADLIALGLPEYARERSGKMLLDIRKKSAASSFGDSIDYRWRQAMSETIGIQPRKTFHSFRHSAVQVMLNAKVDINTRGAIFGHLTGHIEGDIYGGDAEIGDLVEAINLIPSVR